VDMTVPTGLSVSGTPLTTSGTLAISFSAGYSIPTTTKQTQWDSAYTLTSAITSTAAELNKLDGVTSTTSELNLLDGSTAGTVVNSKAVIYGGSGEVAATTVSTTSTASFGGNVSFDSRAGALFYDTDGSNYIQLRAPSSVASNVTFNLPGQDGTSGQVLQTDGAGNLSFATASSGGGASGFQTSTITTAPAASEDDDLALATDGVTLETPFESGGSDPFGVSLGIVYDAMEPVGSTVSVDYGDEEDYVGA